MAAVYLVRQAGGTRAAALDVRSWESGLLATCAPSCTRHPGLSWRSSRASDREPDHAGVADTDRLWDFLAFGVVDVLLSLVMLVGLGTVLLTLDGGWFGDDPAGALFCWLIYRHSEEITRLFIPRVRKWSRVTDVLSDTIPASAWSRRSIRSSGRSNALASATRT